MHEKKVNEKTCLKNYYWRPFRMKHLFHFQKTQCCSHPFIKQNAHENAQQRFDFFSPNFWLYCFHNHAVHWDKNKHIFCFSVTWFIFNLHRKEYFLCILNTYYKCCMWCCKLFNIRWNPLTLHGGSLYIVTDSNPCWPLADSHCPILRWYPGPTSRPLIPFFPPIHTTTIHRQH